MTIRNARRSTLLTALMASIPMALVGHARAQASITRLVGSGNVSFPNAFAMDECGQTIVGRTALSFFQHATVRWSEADGMVVIPELANYSPNNNLIDVREGGSMIAGVDGQGSLFTWNDASGVSVIGPHSSGPVSLIVGAGMNDDVITIAGETGTATFIWKSNAGFIDLGIPPPVSLRDVSGRGGYVIGNRMGGVNAFRWDRFNGVLDIVPPPGTGDFTALATNVDGKVIVGRGSVPPPASSLDHAKVWRAGTGFQLLPELVGTVSSSAMLANHDGSVILGRVNAGPVVWTNNGMTVTLLSDYLTALGADLTGWQLNEALQVSDDGRVIAGSGVYQGQTAQFLAEVDDNGFELFGSGCGIPTCSGLLTVCPEGRPTPGNMNYGIRLPTMSLNSFPTGTVLLGFQPTAAPVMALGVPFCVLPVLDVQFDPLSFYFTHGFVPIRIPATVAVGTKLYGQVVELSGTGPSCPPFGLAASQLFACTVVP